ncbi:MAG TPA: S8 family peptidase [Casimicrobiaceae bacterium]|nr:S8 family peptidase [Casimicrobiaceae bacterium]
MSFATGRTAASAALATLFATFALSFAAPTLAKGEKSMTTLRVMVNPAMAPRGTLPDALRTRVESIAAGPVRITGTTRTGALELSIEGMHDRDGLTRIADKLRTDRAILWAEVPTTDIVRPKAATATKAAAEPGQKLMLRFVEGADVASATQRLAVLAGMPVTIDRTIGAVQVLTLMKAMRMDELEQLAKAFEHDAAVRYADPVRRVRAHRVPNDPRYAEQWSLTHINAGAAWDVGTGSASVTVAVIDTGMLSHPDLEGRLLPGYDFILDAERARDGDGRDPDPRDEGDWTERSDCDGYGGSTSSFHGLFVAGLIAANANNATGIAGVDWAAKILPVRALGKCGGTFDDVVAAINWSAGVPLAGVPTNANPAKVINLSLGGYGPCSAAAQEAVDDALAQGIVVVASAGNESDDVSFYSPASCSGVIAVSALSRGGERSSYSNYGRRVDIAAPGGDVGINGLILSTSADGKTTPGDFIYDSAMGTSFSAPLVSGTLSLMFARNPNLTVGQALSIVQGSSSEFKSNTTCAFGGFCGFGSLDSAAAMASTIPAATNLPAGAVAVIEYYDAALDHYLITTDANEIRTLDATGAGRWQRTGGVFYAWQDASSAPAGVVPRNVCRFHAGPEHQIDSTYFTADAAECNFVMQNQSDVWKLQSSAAFYVEVPNSDGVCRDGTLPVYRFFNGRRDANHRHTIDLSIRRAMQNRIWVADGKGMNGAAMCSLI